ncbi:aromatic ring-hydroxylating oxygenase subunit alpha [Bacillus benzoevorans]|uniref:Phenylpropionate dioxygenase-like ring-hydroxylating dioxygenase large terminal subunit n=1 Tax=Bacillus benzoevorans TaxID=1456 RepID=A0A7X0HTI9_9BACI|nr:aromatic ring-hydroxylating dioxygenase subunit alpha [Bacillus benzoevorans]MBB6446573.1 phenylpropionate dioxygenase-like ring-hydroxylating dioxygenase large terminal subunit [Bacillus benzoevorans]
MAKMKWDELIQPDRVHQKLYTDPEIFAEEISKIFGETWVYLAHESEIPHANDYKTGYLGKRPIIVVRDDSGKIRALFNRCTHRGATVCRNHQGTAKIFTCPYHGWNFKNNGELAGVPWPKAYGEDFDKKEWGLKQIRVESYRGFIFGTLNLQAPSLIDYLGPARDYLDQWLDRYDGKNIEVGNPHRMVYNGNWKLTYDNAADGYHVMFSHRSLFETAARMGENKDMTYFAENPDYSEMTVQYLGNGHTLIDQRPNYKEPGDYWKQQRPQPGREVYEKMIRERYKEEADRLLDQAIGAQMNLNIFPNLCLIGNQIQVIQPYAVDKTELIWYSTTVEGLPEEINLLRMRTQEDFPAFGEPDDMTNFEECHLGLTIPEVEWIHTGRGLGVPGRQTMDGHGVISGPVTDELHIRNYYQEWKRLMSEDAGVQTAEESLKGVSS